MGTGFGFLVSFVGTGLGLLVSFVGTGLGFLVSFVGTGLGFLEGFVGTGLGFLEGSVGTGLGFLVGMLIVMGRIVHYSIIKAARSRVTKQGHLGQVAHDLYGQGFISNRDSL